MMLAFLGLPRRERLIYFTEAAIRRNLSPEFLGLPDARQVFALRWKRGQSPSFFQGNQHQPSQETPEETRRAQEPTGRTAHLRGKTEARRR